MRLIGGREMEGWGHTAAGSTKGGRRLEGGIWRGLMIGGCLVRGWMEGGRRLTAERQNRGAFSQIMLVKFLVGGVGRGGGGVGLLDQSPPLFLWESLHQLHGKKPSTHGLNFESDWVRHDRVSDREPTHGGKVQEGPIP